jgi:hypothetical protein
MKLLLLASFLSLANTPLVSQTLSITSLHTDHRHNPIGMDEPSPGLSWQILADEISVTQSHYQIIVSADIASVMKGIGTSWDSKKVESSQSVQVAYAGKPLTSGKRYWWRVRVWDTHGHFSAWSPAGEWHTGLFRTEDWKGANGSRGISCRIRDASPRICMAMARSDWGRGGIHFRCCVGHSKCGGV